MGGDQISLAFEMPDPLFEIGFDLSDGLLDSLIGAGVVLSGMDEDGRFLADDRSIERIELGEAFDLVAPELDPNRVATVHREDLEGVATHPERAMSEVDVVSLVVEVDKRREQLVAVVLIADLQPERHPLVVARITEAVQGGDRGDNDDVIAGQQRPRC